jgi:hypothetical protein
MSANCFVNYAFAFAGSEPGAGRLGDIGSAAFAPLTNVAIYLVYEFIAAAHADNAELAYKLIFLFCPTHSTSSY